MTQDVTDEQTDRRTDSLISYFASLRCTAKNRNISESRIQSKFWGHSWDQQLHVTDGLHYHRQDATWL